MQYHLYHNTEAQTCRQIHKNILKYLKHKFVSKLSGCSPLKNMVTAPMNNENISECMRDLELNALRT